MVQRLSPRRKRAYPVIILISILLGIISVPANVPTLIGVEDIKRLYVPGTGSNSFGRTISATDIDGVRSAAESGDRLAQYRLGQFYDTGKGVLQNKPEAVR